MSSAIKKLIETVSKQRIAEHREAQNDPELNLLARYPEFLDLVERLLRRGPSGADTRAQAQELFRPETVAILAKQTRDALNAVMTGPQGSAAIEQVKDDCIDLLPEKTRSRLKAGCADVARVAAQDAILCGVVMWLRDLAASRPTREPNATTWTEDMREEARRKAREQRQNGRVA